MAGVTLTPPASPTFPTNTLSYGISPAVVANALTADVVIDSQLYAVSNNSTLPVSGVAQGLNLLNTTNLGDIAYLGTVASATTTTITLSGDPSILPASGACLVLSATLGGQPRTFTRSGAIVTLSSALSGAATAGDTVVFGN
jgi:hypothetical protein